MEINQEKRDREDPEHSSPKRRRTSTNGEQTLEDRTPVKESVESNKTIQEHDDSSSGSDSDTESSSSGTSSSDSDSDSDDFAEQLDNALHQSRQSDDSQMALMDEQEEVTVEEIVPDEPTSIERASGDITADEATKNETPPEDTVDEAAKEETKVEEVPEEQGKNGLVDKSIRGPSSSAFFFTREAYEAYSTDSIDSIVNRHVQWIQQHKTETALAYKRYFNPASPESSKSSPTKRTPSPVAARVPIARNISSPSSSSPAPSSPASGASNPPDVLDSLLSSIHSETKPKRQAVPADIAAAAVSLAQPVQEEGIILGENVKDMYQALCDLDRKRIQQYPRYYAHHSHLKPPVFGKVQTLRHAKNIATLGKIAYCSSDGSYPEKLDMRKNLIQSDTNTDDHYRGKLPLTLNQDPVIAPVVKNEKPHIVTTLDTLVKIVEIPNDLSVQVEIPIIVKEDDDGNKTVYLDPPLLSDDASVHNQNQAVYDLAFKSHRLEWNTRQSQVSEKNSSEGVATPERNPYEDEHLRYGLWMFGDMPILVRHQVDGLLKGISNANCQVYLKTNISYKNPPAQDARVPNLTRARYWIQSYLTGHGKILEGRVDVNTNQVLGVTLFHMRDIMKENWTPSKESEFTRQLFQELHGSLKPGNYLLHKTSSSQQTSILQSVAQDASEYDLYTAHGMNSS